MIKKTWDTNNRLTLTTDNKYTAIGDIAKCTFRFMVSQGITKNYKTAYNFINKLNKY